MKQVILTFKGKRTLPLKYLCLQLLMIIYCTNPVFAEGFTGKRPIDLVKNPNAFDRTKHAATIYQIEKYLSSFKTMEARFTQTAGTRIQLRRGRILISRPGKARWDYFDPIKTTLIVNNGRMSHFDKQLDQVVYASVPNSPLEILLNENVKLSGDIKIINLKETNSSVEILLADNRKDAQHETLSLSFSKRPFQLTRLNRTNDSNHRTTLQLEVPVLNVPLEENLFSMANPKSLKKTKN